MTAVATWATQRHRLVTSLRRDHSAYFVEIVEADRSNCTANARSDRFAHVAHEVGNTEQSGGVLLAVRRLRDVEVPA